MSGGAAGAGVKIDFYYFLNTNSMHPKGHWKYIQNHVSYAKALAEKHGWTAPQDWSNIRQKHFKEFEGDALLRATYGGSPWRFVLNVVAAFIYPNYLWLEWKIGYQAPNGFWKDCEKVRFCLDVLASSENFTSLDDFYGVSQATYEKHGVSSIQNKFGSHLDMLKFAYPEKKWKEWKFRPVTRGFWNIRENVISAVKDTAQELGIVEPSGWYKHTVATIDKYCGEGLISNKYRWSLLALLKDVYPDYPWKPYMLEKAPHRYWQNDEHCREWLSDYMELRGYKTIEDLYKTRSESVREFPSGGGIIDRFGGSYIRLFMHFYPDLDITHFFKAGQSKIANECLSQLEEVVGLLEREYKIGLSGQGWKVDGFHLPTNTVYEFLGDYYHGHLKYDRDTINPTTGITYGEMYRTTIERLNRISKSFKVMIIWESDYKKGSSWVEYQEVTL